MASIVAATTEAGSVTKAATAGVPQAQVVAVTDGEGNILAVGPGSVATPGVVRLEDGTTTNLATISAFHNADNQALAGTAFGLLTGGVAQLLNATGNLDRQRETSADVIGNAGIATGTQQVAWPVTCGPVTSGAITGSATAQTITLTAVAGTTRGVAWALSVGQTLVLEAGTATQEAFVITALNVGAKTVTGIIRNNHGASAAATAFFYDQARSAMVADGSPGQGISAGATYLFNSALNSAAGGWEGERSAAGELDGATGTGTAVAAEYEYNSGGPGGGNFDRARNLQGKGVTTATLNGAANSGQNQATLNGSVPAVGQPVYLLGGTAEVAYVQSVASQTVTFTANLANTHGTGTNVSWDTYAGPVGPGLSGFLPTGIGIEEEALYDPVSGLFYIERSATQDGVAAANVVAECGMLWNGTTLDRMRGSGGVEYSTVGGSTTVSIAAGTATDTVVKASAGRLCRVLVTSTAGAAATNIFDNASGHTGTIIGYLVSAVAAGTVVDFQMPATAGITVQGAATNPAMTISYY